MFESCDDYDDALRLLKRESADFPTFVHLVGPAKGQAAVVEVYPHKQNRVHRFSGEPLAITNHYLDDLEYGDEEWEEEEGQVYWTNSKNRLDLLRKRAAKCAAPSLEGVGRILAAYPILDEDTQQSMVFHPKTGTFFLRRL